MIQNDLSILGIGVLSLAGCSPQSDSMEDLKTKLRNNPPSGVVAYAVGDEIHVCEMPNCFSELKLTKSDFQLSDKPYALLWLNEREIVYATFHPSPPEKLNEIQLELQREAAKAGANTYNLFTRSLIIQILDTVSGERRTIVDPYAEDSPVRAIMGDIGKKEMDAFKQMVDVVKDHNQKPWYKKGDLRGSFSPGFKPDDIGYSPSTQKIYYKINDKWYAGSVDGSSFELPSRVPSDMICDQRQDKTGGYVLDEATFLQQRVYLTDKQGNARIYLEPSSCSPAWRVGN